jgi:hypothetical protein
MYQTKTIAIEGCPVKLVVPTSIPSDKRFEYLEGLWREHVRLMDGDDWKGRVNAVVPSNLANDMAEAMENNGALIDKRVNFLMGHMTYLYSNGYRAHGF